MTRRLSCVAAYPMAIAAIVVAALGCESDPPSVETPAPPLVHTLAPDGFRPIPLPGGGFPGSGIGVPLPQAGFRWDPVWDALIAPEFMSGAAGIPPLRATSAPSLVVIGGFRGFGGLQIFYRGGADNELLRVGEGSSTPQRAGVADLKSAPASVAHNGVVDIVFAAPRRPPSPFEFFAIRHARWNGSTFDSFPSGESSEEISWFSDHATPAIAATRVTDAGRLVTRLDVFASQGDETLAHLFKIGDGAWTFDKGFRERLWTDGPAGNIQPVAISHRGQLDLVFRDKDGAIYRMTSFPDVCPHETETSTCWSDRELLMTDAASAPAIALSGTRMDVFAMRNDGHLYQRRSNAGGWGPLLVRATCVHPTAPDMKSLLKAGTPFAAPSAVATTTGRVDLAIWGTDGNLWRDAWEFGGRFGRVASPPPCSCGTSATACCEDGTCGGGLVCNEGVCSGCGSRDAVCCAASTCGPSLTCVSGRCTCGDKGEACCDGGCNAGLTCQDGTCSCGGAGQPCCGGTACSSQALTCQAGICATPPPPEPTPFAPTFSILKRRCSGCHTASGPGPYFYTGAEDTSYAKLVGVASSLKPGVLRVQAGEPDSSDLWIRVASGNMPPGALLPPDDLNTIKTWILTGAAP